MQNAVKKKRLPAFDFAEILSMGGERARWIVSFYPRLHFTHVFTAADHTGICFFHLPLSVPILLFFRCIILGIVITVHR